MGIGAAVTAGIAAVSEAFAGAGAFIAGGLGLEGATLGGIEAGALIGTGLEGATVGGLVGGGIDAVTGKPILPGILEGGLTGAFTGGGGALGGTAGAALGGAAGGALGSAVEGQNPLTGALYGGAGGLATGALTSAFSGAPEVSSTGAPLSDSGIGTAGGAGAAGGPSAAGFTPPTLPGGQAPNIDMSSSFGQNAALANSQGGALFTGASDAQQAAAGLGVGQGDLINPPPAPPGMGGAYTDPGGGQPGQIMSVPANAGTGTFSPTTGQPTTGLQSIFGGSGGTSGGNTAGSLGGVGNAWGDISSFLGGPQGKTLGVLASGAGLARDLLAGNQPLKGQNAQSAIAAQTGQQGALLSSYLTSGTLPPGVQTAINQATQAAQQQIRGNYAARGIPPGSSMEQQDLVALQERSTSQGVQIAQQLLNSGAGLTQLSAGIYNQLVASNQAENNAVNQAVGNLASALAGGVKINLGNQTATAQP